MHRALKVLAALLLIVAVSNVSSRCCAQGQRFQFYASMAKDGAVPELCTTEQMVLAPIVYRYEQPATWRWIIVCDEMAWRQVEKHEGRESSAKGVYLAFTEPDNRLTYIRGWTLLHPIDDRPEMQPDHTVRHELGHILKNTGDERVAEAYADVLLARWKREEAALAEAREKSQPAQLAENAAAATNSQ